MVGEQVREVLLICLHNFSYNRHFVHIPLDAQESGRFYILSLAILAVDARVL